MLMISKRANEAKSFIVRLSISTARLYFVFKEDSR